MLLLKIFTGQTTGTAVLYDPDTGYTIFVYTNSAASASYATVASNSGTTYTVGATTTLTDVGDKFAMAYDTLTNRVILCYEKQDSQPIWICGCR